MFDAHHGPGLEIHVIVLPVRGCRFYVAYPVITIAEVTAWLHGIQKGYPK